MGDHVLDINLTRSLSSAVDGGTHSGSHTPCFIRRWIPELARVPDHAIHTPWTLDRTGQAAAGCRIGTDYPSPVVDHLEAARAARDRVWAVRRGGAFTAEADRIQETHGSRRSGLPPSNPTRRRKADPGQTVLDL